MKQETYSKLLGTTVLTGAIGQAALFVELKDTEYAEKVYDVTNRCGNDTVRAVQPVCNERQQVTLVYNLGDFRMVKAFGQFLVLAHPEHKNFAFVVDLTKANDYYRPKLVVKVPGGWAVSSLRMPEHHYRYRTSESFDGDLKYILTQGVRLATEADIGELPKQGHSLDTILLRMMLFQDDVLKRNLTQIEDKWYLPVNQASIDTLMQLKSVDLLAANKTAQHVGVTIKSGKIFVIPLIRNKNGSFYVKRPETQRMDIRIREGRMPIRLDNDIQEIELEKAAFYYLGNQEANFPDQYESRITGFDDSRYCHGEHKGVDTVYQKIVKILAKKLDSFMLRMFNNGIGKTYTATTHPNQRSQSQSPMPEFRIDQPTQDLFIRLRGQSHLTFTVEEYFGFNLFGINFNGLNTIVGAYTLMKIMDEYQMEESSEGARAVSIGHVVVVTKNGTSRKFIILEEVSDGFFLYELGDYDNKVIVHRSALNHPAVTIEDGYEHLYKHNEGYPMFSYQRVNGDRRYMRVRVDGDCPSWQINVFAPSSGRYSRIDRDEFRQMCSKLVQPNVSYRNNRRSALLYNAARDYAMNAVGSNDSTRIWGAQQNSVDFDSFGTFYAYGELNGISPLERDNRTVKVHGVYRVPHKGEGGYKLKASVYAAKGVFIPARYSYLLSIDLYEPGGGRTSFDWHMENMYWDYSEETHDSLMTGRVKTKSYGIELTKRIILNQALALGVRIGADISPMRAYGQSQLGLLRQV